MSGSDELKEAGIPIGKKLLLDVGYILGLQGPSQGTSRTDNIQGPITLHDYYGDGIAEATNITVTVSELTDVHGPYYLIAVNIDVKPFGTYQTLAPGYQPVVPLHGTSVFVDFRDVNRSIIANATWPQVFTCDYPPFHFAKLDKRPAAGWLPQWASTSLGLGGAFTSCL